MTLLEGLNAGAIRHIKSMTGAGTATEVWTLDEVLPNLTLITTKVSVAPFKKIGEKLLTTYKVHEDRLFIPIRKPIVGRKFLAKVVCEMDNMRPHFSSLAFVYDELSKY